MSAFALFLRVFRVQRNSAKVSAKV